MKLSQIAKKPQLIKVSIDDEDIVKEFGEPLEFYTWDRQPMDIFLKLSSVDTGNQSAIISSVRELVMDEQGKQILSGEEVLPTWILMRVMTKVVESLGK
ncbi:hypothetical protein UFOVP322_13 [uncultured Caudovirales phage]|uniref:Uncharacterized protein n=1 Tax=uncultured Caudovirales phage TaxID=2100421 RepID=A0A6J5LWD4_9CAUD|nr:hypothetical protein UFOVP322_13 [uncultured Caudovirales phage]CAB4160648.1 hypothetical protein UFOVP771_11 [uncultured Caudovirales phage]CAB4166093.1 hypothetical protein UFOVP850_11 [uncultured Caudovirales phage]